MKYQYLINAGDEQPLGSVAFHHDAPLTRFLMLQKDSVEGDGGIRIITHMLNNPTVPVPEYTELHKHDFDEINLILSNDNSLVYRIKLEDEVYELSSPTTVYIPKGIAHAAEVISGQGMYVTVSFTKEYKAYK
jgi:hypothetical protein